MTIVEKPWGREEILEVNDKYVVKKLVMKPGHRCSLQYHQKKLETLYVLQGVMKLTLGEEENMTLILKPGESRTIPVGQIHRMSVPPYCTMDAIYLETSTPELDDVVRVKDDYNRHSDSVALQTWTSEGGAL